MDLFMIVMIKNAETGWLKIVKKIGILVVLRNGVGIEIISYIILFIKSFKWFL